MGAVLPTGSGKSLIMVELIDRLRKNLSIDDSIMVLCHLSDPLRQLHDTYKALGARPARLHYWTKLAIPSIQIDTIFCTMQKMSRPESLDKWAHHKAGKLNRCPKYIMIDEAHAYGALSYEKICEIFPDAKVIGLSATPFRSNKFSFGLFDKVSYTISMGELISLGFLTPPKVEVISLKDMDSTPDRIALSYKIWWERERKRGLVTVVYFPTTEIAKAALTAYTQDKTVSVRYVDGKMNSEPVKKVIEDAKAGLVDIIVNCQKLETGVDIPNIGAVIMPYECNSVVRYMQRVGRALRKFAGKEFANIYLCGDTPSIEKKQWNKIHDKAIELRDPLPSESLQDNFDQIDSGQIPRTEMVWTENAIEACKKLEGQGFITLSDHLASKRFPKKYDRYINSIMSGAIPTEGYNDSKISIIQNEILTKKFGFKENHTAKLTKKEASALINGFQGHLNRDPYIIQSGAHIGKHPSQLPGLARKYAKGDTKMKLQMWWKAGRPEPRA